MNPFNVYKLPTIFLLFLVAIACCGCDEGSDITLSPISPSCDLPYDNNWQTISPVSGHKLQKAAVWLKDDTPIIVGSGGLVLTFQGDTWDKSFLSGKPTLNSITECANGEALVVGTNGSIFSRSNSGQWIKQDSGTTANLLHVEATGDQACASGFGGTLLQRRDNVWSQVDYPSRDVLSHFCCSLDSIYVVDSTRKILVGDGRSWEGHLVGPWGLEPVYDVASAADGCLVVLSDSLYCRDESGWSTKGDFHNTYNYDEMLWENNILVLGGSGLLFDTTTSNWDSVPINGYRPSGFVAIKDSSQWLAATESGYIIWCSPQEIRYDLNGRLPHVALNQFAGQAPVVISSAGLFSVEPTGLSEIPVSNSGVYAEIARAYSIDGISIEDFYTIRYDSLFHYVNYQKEMAVALPEAGRFRGLAVDNTGQVFVSSDLVVYLWTGTEFRDVLQMDPEGRPRISVRSTSGGQIIASYRSNNKQITYYFEGSEFVHLNTTIRYDHILESPSGYWIFLDYSYGTDIEYHRPSSGVVETAEVNLIHGCDGVYPRAGVDHTSGLYFFSYRNTMVFRMHGEIWENSWDLVAGPCLSTIEKLSLGDDGTLIAQSVDGRILVYSP